MRASLRFLTRALGSSALCGATIAALTLTSPRPAHASPIAMTADEFRLYKDYQAALTDPKVEKIPEKKRFNAIARNFKVNERVLRNAVDKGDQFGKTAGRDCEREIRAILDGTALKGRVQDVKVDDSEGHVVTYISWKNKDGSKLEEEASLVALMAAKGAPISSTIALWANDSGSGRKVFDAKINADAAGRFSQDHIAMFATARYIRVFEDVHNAYKGTPPPN